MKITNKHLQFVVAASIILCMLLIPVKAASLLAYNINVSYTNDTAINENTQITTSSALIAITTDSLALCRYSSDPSIPYDAMPSNFDLEYGTLHKKVLTNLIDGKYAAYIKCKSSQNSNVSGELGVNFWVNLPVSAQISVNDGQDITIGKTEVKVRTSKTVNEAPILSYTTDGTTYTSVPLAGSDRDWKGYIVISGSNQNEVGSFKFTARDLEGNIGTQITSGSIFSIDTTPPSQLLDIKAGSRNQGINLTWRSDESGLKYNVYRSTSPGVGYSDFYKQTSGSVFIDTNTVQGQIYYYRVTAVDDAGNEGPFSIEVYASPIFSNDSTNTVLDQRYVGLVDNLVQTSLSVKNSIKDIADKFSTLSEDEKNIYAYLKLSNTINGAQNSVNSLISEEGGYKLQSLTQDELNKKISSANVRLNIIKSNVPESINILNKTDIRIESTDSDLSNAFLQAKPGIDYNQISELSKSASDPVKNGKFKVQGTMYTVEITYLDGTKKDTTLVRKVVTYNEVDKENKSIIEVIPKEFAQSSNDLNVYNKDYTIINEDPVLSFSPDTTEIVYYINGLAKIDSGTKTQTIIFDESALKSETSHLTGFVTLSDLSSNVNSGIVIGIVIIGILIVYLIIIKRKKPESIEFLEIKNKIDSLKSSIISGNGTLALREYKTISQIYKDLTKSEQQKVYPMISMLHQKLSKLSKGEYSKSILAVLGLFFGVILLLTSFSMAVVEHHTFSSKNVTVNSEMEVRRFIMYNPSVESVTYNDNALNESYGFVNVFGGIGKNFMMYPNQVYEVSFKNISDSIN